MRKVLFIPNVSDIKVIDSPVEMSNEGFDYENIANAVMAYIVVCLPSGVPSILADMLDEYIHAKKYNTDGGVEYIDYLRDLVNGKVV